jgi:hypothetical protein
MKKKRLRLILIIFSFTVFFTMALMFTGCSLDEQLWDAREETEAKAAEQEVKEEQKEQIRALQENEKQSEEEVTEEEATVEEDSFPNELITYNGDMSGLTVIVIVDYKTTEVTGSLECPAIGYPDYVFTDGKIDIDTLKITAKSSGVREVDSDGNVIQTQEFTITGTISEDLTSINGAIANNFDESWEFNATR